MLEKFIVPAIVAVGTMVTGIVGVDIYQNRQIAKKVDMSVKELKSATRQDINDGLIRKAVEEAANSAINDYIRDVKTEVISQARRSLDDEARRAVREASVQIQKEVSDRVSTEASLIDMSSLKKSAREKAEQKILDKFDGNLEDLLSKFNDNLSNVQKIYGGIADAITKTNAKNNSIKFSLE